MYKRLVTISSIVLAVILLAACSAAATKTPSQSGLSQLSTGAAQTIAVMSTQLTAAAAQSTAAPATATQLPPTLAASATSVSSEAPTALATALPVTPSPVPFNTSTQVIIPIIIPTSTPPVSGDCELISVSPAAYTLLPAGGDFDSKWQIRNSSSSEWNSNEVDFEYLSGTKMYKRKAIYDLSDDVAVNDDITLIVDSLAPKTSGTYTMTWGLVRSGARLCTMSVTIRVK